MQSTYAHDLVLVHSDSYANWILRSGHPTQGRRFTNGRDAILEKIETTQFDARVDIRAPRLATRRELNLVHTSAYISEVLDDHRTNDWDGDNEMLAGLAQTFAGGTLVALDALLQGETRLAVHLPGAKHHAQADHSSGFCVFADFAIAAKICVERGMKVAIFDFDAHHGDGTENLCADDPNILTFSVHQFSPAFFPGTGASSDESRHIYNVPLPPGAGDAELMPAVGQFLNLFYEFQPDIVFIAAGADGHFSDPLASLEFTPGGASLVASNIRNRFDGPILMGGAGGYQPDNHTPEMWASTVVGLMGV